MRRPQEGARELPAGQYRYILGTLLLTGAATLVLEIVGTRVISPYYGSSLYCWSALITVTLVSLAAGYNMGGRLADRSPTLLLFCRLICVGAAATAFVPLLRDPILRLTSPLGVQLGALASATLLMAPALVALSALGPLAIRLITQAVTSVGRSAGDVYAVSTLGSVGGAVLAGFVLVPKFSISHILYGITVLLLVLAAIGFYLSSSRAPTGSLAAAAAAALFGFWPRPVPDTNVRMSRESSYGQIKVLDFAQRRYLLVNGTTQSMAELPHLETESQYAQCLEYAVALRPKTSRALVVGLGAGLLPKALEKHYGFPVDSVEIDPEIVTAARSFFDYSPEGDVFLQDGRRFLEGTDRRYGIVFLDAFGSETPPYHLFTTEAFETIRRRLEPGGVLAVNTVSIVHGRGSAPWRSLLRTLKAVFPNVRAYQASDTYEDLGNIVFFASEGSIDPVVPVEALRQGIRVNASYMLNNELRHSAAGSPRRAVLMTDDHAPMEFLMAQTSTRWRAQLQRKIADILLY